MKIWFFGDFSVETKTLMAEEAALRGHCVAKPADVVFVMAREGVSLVREAAKCGIEPCCVHVLRASWIDAGIMREYFLTRLVNDIVYVPHSSYEAGRLFEALEVGDTSNIA